MISEAREQKVCDKKLVISFIADRLEDDDRLDFLFHLDECPDCWDEVYNATKAGHPHFYKKTPRKKAKKTRGVAKISAKGGKEEVA